MSPYLFRLFDRFGNVQKIVARDCTGDKEAAMRAFTLSAKHGGLRVEMSRATDPAGVVRAVAGR